MEDAFEIQVMTEARTHIKYVKVADIIKHLDLQIKLIKTPEKKKRWSISEVNISNYYKMSYTEIYKFNSRGKAEHIGETNNSWLGAAAVWGILEDKYLEPYFPSWGEIGEKYSRLSMMFRPELMQEIWDLDKNDKVSDVDKIVLLSTFDNVVVLRKDIDRLLNAFEQFEGETSLKDQAQIIRNAIKEDPKLIGIAWNQTSVNADSWITEGKNGKWRPYNIKRDSKHWSLFDEL